MSLIQTQRQTGFTDFVSKKQIQNLQIFGETRVREDDSFARIEEKKHHKWIVWIVCFQNIETKIEREGELLNQILTKHYQQTMIICPSVKKYVDANQSFSASK